MLHHRFAAGGIPDGDQIEPVFVARAAVAQHPDRGHPGDVPLFPLMDRLDRRPEGGGPTGFYFDEGNGTALPDDQIEIVAAELEAMGLDRPATRGEKGYGDTLAPEAEELALILPLCDRGKAAGAGHAS